MRMGHMALWLKGLADGEAARVDLTARTVPRRTCPSARQNGHTGRRRLRKLASSFVLLETEPGLEVLRSYYRRYIELARKNAAAQPGADCSFVVSTIEGYRAAPNFAVYSAASFDEGSARRASASTIA